MEKKDLNRFRKILMGKKQVIVINAEKTLREESQLDVSDLPDEIDMASSEYNQSLAFRLRDREKSLLRKIDKAIKRLEEGEYGICENCEEDIDVRRLEARPVTTLCIRCKEEQEQMEKSYI